ncbi:MAG TPA: hypothetical protein VEO74_17075 [Thermoanaerobaculia bacterium]|nr:hypothetical protein [Thermoanaerobaculia bacterium]
MTFFPTVAEERLMAVGAPVPWKSFSMLPRIAFFILSTICAIALFGFIEASLRSGHAGALIAGVMAIAAAEILIARFRFFAAGLEEALWFVGVMGIAGRFIPYSASWETWLTVFGVASLVAAIRLLNPFCAVLGAVLVPFSFGSFAVPFCALVALVALVLLPLPRRRPSIEHTIGALAVVMPLAAYLFAKEGTFVFDPIDAGALLLYALGALIVGVHFRLHAPLLALFPTLGCFAYEVRELSGLSLEARLIVWGSVLLGVSIAIERYLKTPRHGITSRPLRDDQLGDLLQLAGTIAIAPHHQKPPEQGGPQIESGGSSFGGAGAGGTSR